MDKMILPLNSLEVLKKRYLLKDDKQNIIETPAELFRRVASNIAKAERNFKSGFSKEEVEEEFYKMMASLEFLPNSPTLMNAGTSLGQLSACFVIPVEDSMEGIFDALKDMAKIHQTGGGTGFSFSKLRPKGDLVSSTKGAASGPVSFMSIFDAATGVIVQGGRRRGANMGIMRCDHPDIVEFIEAKIEKDRFSNFNLSVGITDLFIEAVKRGEGFDLINPRTKRKAKRVNAKAVFDLIASSAWRTGDPGLVFLDEINRRNPTPDIGRIEATNPCVVGDTLISTDKGLMHIEELSKGVHTRILTDNRVSLNKEGVSLNKLVKAWPTGIKETLKLITKSGYELIATPSHLIKTDQGWLKMQDLIPMRHSLLIQSGEGRWGRIIKLPFEPDSDVKGKNGKTYKFDLPKKWSRKLGQVLGWLIADGYLNDSAKSYRVGFVFSPVEKKLLNYYKKILTRWYRKDVKIYEGKNGCLYLSYHSKFLVDFFKRLGVNPVKARDKKIPTSVYTAPREAVVGFLQGIFTADGTVNFVKDKSSYIRLTSKSLDLVKGIQLLLLNFGIPSRIYDRSRPRRQIFPYTTINGDRKVYVSDGILYELETSKDAVVNFLDKIGFLKGLHKDKIKKFYRKSFYKAYFKDKVIKIEPAGKRLVYDLNEPVTHSFIANGIVVHNCGELPLLPYESCNLASINLARMVKNNILDRQKLKGRIKWGIRFLDDVIEVNRFPLPEIKKITFKNRKIGLGVMGFADMLIELGIPYNSKRATDFAKDLMAFIHKESIDASTSLARERGVFSNFKRSIYAKKNLKLRNATVNTIAPTGTISIIAGCSSGIEPLFAISFIRNVLSGTKLFEVNRTFEEVIKKRGIYNKALLAKIARHGSLRNLREIPKEIRDIFITAFDMMPEHHLYIQAAFQKHTDNSVSKTINLPSDATVEDVRKIYLLAHNLRLKGITVYRYGSKEDQVLSFDYRKGAKAAVRDESIIAESEYSGGCVIGTCPF